jgi:hypothetical protein
MERNRRYDAGCVPGRRRGLNIAVRHDVRIRVGHKRLRGGNQLFALHRRNHTLP